MADPPRKPLAIMLVDIQQEILPSGRKLLNCTFKGRYSDWRYRWTPPWPDKEKERGVERLFLNAIAVEEWNDPKGVWDEELKKLAEELPLLKELRLPVQVECSRLATVSNEEWAYSFEVSIIAENGYLHYDDRDASFRVENCEIQYEHFKQDFINTLGQRRGLGISKRAAQELRGNFGDPVGVTFSVFVPQGLSRQDYRIIGREVASFVRSYLRRVLGDYEALKRGFED